MKTGLMTGKTGQDGMRFRELMLNDDTRLIQEG